MDWPVGKIASIDRGWLLTKLSVTNAPGAMKVGKIASIDRGWLPTREAGLFMNMITWEK